MSCCREATQLHGVFCLLTGRPVSAVRCCTFEEKTTHTHTHTQTLSSPSPMFALLSPPRAVIRHTRRLFSAPLFSACLLLLLLLLLPLLVSYRVGPTSASKRKGGVRGGGQAQRRPGGGGRRGGSGGGAGRVSKGGSSGLWMKRHLQVQCSRWLQGLLPSFAAPPQSRKNCCAVVLVRLGYSRVWSIFLWSVSFPAGSALPVS